jgi:hypothetical protein
VRDAPIGEIDIRLLETAACLFDLAFELLTCAAAWSMFCCTSLAWLTCAWACCVCPDAVW